MIIHVQKEDTVLIQEEEDIRTLMRHTGVSLEITKAET